MFKVIPLRASGKSLVRFTINTVNQKAGAAHAVTGGHGGHGAHVQSVVARDVAYPRIGKREIVGFGKTGEPQYYDDNASPLPSIRWTEDTAEVKALREKAKGDWGNLTVAEKKICMLAVFVFLS
jgi:hypothetical protein